jgi:hypothetical protein
MYQDYAIPEAINERERDQNDVAVRSSEHKNCDDQPGALPVAFSDECERVNGIRVSER